MTPFNPNAKCPKCGGETIENEWWPDRLFIEDGEPLPEHIERLCLTCGYSWPEAPMDKDDAA